jgi:hypothetical protein
MYNFIFRTQTDAFHQPFKSQSPRHRMVVMIAAVLFVSAAVLLIMKPQESVVAAPASATSTPTKTATATVTSTRITPLPTSTPSEPSLRNPKFLKDKSLIEIDNVCDAPCWHGITPGKTTWSDAFVILSGEPDFDKLQTQLLPGIPDGVGASWQPTDGESCCQIISEDGQIVSSIFLQIAPDITVKQLIDARGEPEYVLGTAGTDTQAIINLFYPEQGMIVFAFVAGAATGRLSETSEILGVYYTTPDRMDLGIKLSSLYGWKSYQPFSAYAPDAVAPDFKVTQSVTLTPTKEATHLPSG